MLRLLFLAVSLATPVVAQVTNHAAEGNLEATYDVPCLEISKIRNEYSPADIAGGVRACFREGKDDQAVEMLVVMQLRAAFDIRRVKDRTAHQAGRVLALNLHNAGGATWEQRMSRAFERFGAAGSKRHEQLCAVQKQVGPPTHSPRYMIQHGMGAFTKDAGDGLVKGFDAKSAWADVLKNYLKCDL